VLPSRGISHLYLAKVTAYLHGREEGGEASLPNGGDFDYGVVSIYLSNEYTWDRRGEKRWCHKL
jgi:hypothetical protein